MDMAFQYAGYGTLLYWTWHSRMLDMAFNFVLNDQPAAC